MKETNALADRKMLWKMHHAIADFSMVIDICRCILDKEMKFDDPIYYALVTSVYTIYGRPFTQSIGAGKLDEKVVPAEHRALHEQLLKHRHQVYAHADAINAQAEFGNISQVRFFVGPGKIQPGVVRWRSEPIVLKEIIILCEALIKKARYWKNKIQNKYFPHIKVPLGEYVIDLDPGSTQFLTPALGSVKPRK